MVPDPSTQPYRLIAVTVYPKNATKQIPLKRLAAIFSAVTGPIANQDEPRREERFGRIRDGNGTLRSICMNCCDIVSVSADPNEMEAAEKAHQCSGEPS